MKCKEVNYCGFGKSYIVKPPYWAMFNADCKIHDENYDTGGKKEDRLKADLGFLWRMLEDINKVEDYKKKKRSVKTAIIYYLLVRVFGRFSFKFKK